MNNETDKELLSKMRSAKQKNANQASATNSSWVKDESEIDQNQYDPDKIAAQSKANDPLLGKVLFGTYKIEKILGEGAMGIVYKAKQLAFNRYVALKTIKTEDPSISDRFTQEVKVHAQLKHENIVEAIDCLIAPNNQPFFVMEYLEGIELEDLIKTNELKDNPLELANIITQIGKALEFAHEKGIVHRDLKPGNIVLLEEEGQLKVKVVDFGIAKVAQDIQKLTKTGQALGSPLYMSPEQCMGEEIDGKSDIYSLAIVLYECVTGELPFHGPNLVETMKLHCDPNEMPQKMSELVPDFPCVEQLDSVIMKALSFFPESRHQTCAEFNKDIQFWLESVKNNNANRSVPGTSRRIGKATKAVETKPKPQPSEPSRTRPQRDPVPTPSTIPPARKPVSQPGLPTPAKSGVASFAPAIVVGLIGGLIIMVSILVTALFFMKEKVNELKTPNTVQTEQVVPSKPTPPQATTAPEKDTPKPKEQTQRPAPVKPVKPKAPAKPKAAPVRKVKKTSKPRPKPKAIKKTTKPKPKPKSGNKWTDLNSFKD